eukprot:802357-Rhodomonas_salina.3
MLVSCVRFRCFRSGLWAASSTSQPVRVPGNPPPGPPSSTTATVRGPVRQNGAVPGATPTMVNSDRGIPRYEPGTIGNSESVPSHA